MRYLYGGNSSRRWAIDVLFHASTRSRRIISESEQKMKRANSHGLLYEMGRRDAARSVLLILERAEEARLPNA